MKKSLCLALALFVSGGAVAATDHYVLRDGDYVRHLKITKLGDETKVSADVDFEAAANASDSSACSVSIGGEAKTVADNELVMKKHSESEASYCELKVHLSATGAKIEESKDCDNFAVGKCHFTSDGKELVKIK